MQAIAKALDSLSEEALRARSAHGFAADAQSRGLAEEPLEFAATSVDAHAPTASSPSSQGAAASPHDTPAAASVAEQQLGHDFRTLIVVTVLAALAVVGSMLWLVRPPHRGTALQSELQQAVARCRPSRVAGPIEIRVALGTDGTPALTLANPTALPLPDATCVQRELDEVRRALDPADLEGAPFFIQSDPLDSDVAAPGRGR